MTPEKTKNTYFFLNYQINFGNIFGHFFFQNLQIKFGIFLVNFFQNLQIKLTKNISEIYLKMLEKFNQTYFRNLFEDFGKMWPKIFPKFIWRFWKKNQYSLRGPPSLGGVGGRSQTCHLSKCFNFFLSLKPYGVSPIFVMSSARRLGIQLDISTVSLGTETAVLH